MNSSGVLNPHILKKDYHDGRKVVDNFGDKSPEIKQWVERNNNWLQPWDERSSIMNSLVFEDVLWEYSKEWESPTDYTMNVDDEHEIEYIRWKIMIDEFFETERDPATRRKAYKKLLLHYHPDKWGNNQSLEKEMIDDHILRYLKQNEKRFKEPYWQLSHSTWKRHRSYNKWGNVFKKWK